MNGNPTSEQIRLWLESLQKKRRDLEQQLSPLLEERARIDEQDSLLRSLLASFPDESPGRSERAESTSVATGGIREYVEARVVEVLEEEGGPLHINEIHSRFRERGFKIPGAGKPVNITTHIRKSAQISSLERGVYSLQIAESAEGSTQPTGSISREETKVAEGRRADENGS